MTLRRYTAKPARQWEGDALPSARSPVVVPALELVVQPIAKEAIVRDKAYRMLVAAMACIRCGIEGHSQAAHGPCLGKGLKASDRELFPLCTVRGNGCHEAYDQYRMFPDKHDRALAGAMWAARTRLALGVE